MDPNANLREQREIAAEIIANDDESTADGITRTTRQAELAVRLAELVQALDEWIRRGGFLPHDWAAYGVDDQR